MSFDVLISKRLCSCSIFFKRFRSARRRRFFIRQWDACNVVASLVNDHLLVHV